jgi:hypothetical protein
VLILLHHPDQQEPPTQGLRHLAIGDDEKGKRKKSMTHWDGLSDVRPPNRGLSYATLVAQTSWSKDGPLESGPSD